MFGRAPFGSVAFGANRQSAASAGQTLFPGLFTNAQTFYQTAAIPYPWHPGEVRPPSGGVPEASRGSYVVLAEPRAPYPTTAGAARGSYVVGASARQPYPSQAEADRAKFPVDA